MESFTLLVVLVGFVFVAYLLGVRDSIVSEKKLTAWLKENYGNAPMRKYKDYELDHIRGYYENHTEEFQIDDITWNDLNMDGVFARMNYCLSATGEEYLYYMLRTPQTGDDCESVFDDMEKKISFFSENGEARLKYQLIFNKIGRKSRYSIYDYLKVLDNNIDFSNKRHYLMIVLILLSIVLCFFKFGLGIILLLALTVGNIVMYFGQKNTIEPYLETYRYVLKAINSVALFSKNNYPELSDDIEKLKSAADELKGFGRGSYILMSPTRMNSSANLTDLFLDYIRMWTHVDIIKFNKMYKLILEKRNEMDTILTILGRLDALISVACFRASLQGCVSVPEFTTDADGIRYSAKELIHPLIETPVPNSINTDKGLLITGSNASGKSTFLKTAAINAILSQSVHTAMATSYKAPLYRIYSSMALNDNILEGDSYYIVEIKSMKRIIDASKTTGAPVLCFVDEVLRGTNTVERIAASTEILKSFADSGVLCFAATHDIELTALLNKDFNLYHFEGNVTDNDVHFDYMIKEGAAINRNAIRLLGVLAYDSGIVDRAQKLADKFTETGVWA
ncbi:hypothetical protein D6856_00445 [Butyrivibrio sp. XB500-5]|uniref:MutS-related protein n=1 Tax=Butyrivibrio sp. XB500-5 TaxID=2364880 RepID=UPI000EAA643B|nr:hypothetical protein [Butyrivibrio sp. XB500-5]RKM62632.1 hypothetical protein D6856_00445 [Butyrivibrio sp. XB500-5]